MKMLNQVKLTFAGRSVNEGFARAALAAFLVQLDPTVPQLADIKTAVSEAVTNCIVHAYPDHIGPVTVTAAIYEVESFVLRYPTVVSASRMSPRQWNRCSRQVTPRNEPASALLLCRALWIRSGFRLPRGAEPV